MNKKHTVSILAIATLLACGGRTTTPEPAPQNPPQGGEQLGTPQVTTNMPADAGTAMADAAIAAPAEPSRPPVAVVAGTPTPIPENLRPRVQITAPRDNQVVRSNRVEVRLRVTDWPAPQDGRHVHLILDNEPYRRIDDPSRPIPLENLSEGTHVLRAFPGWGTHESVKREGAFALTVFHVGRRSENFAFDRTAPLLTYSRPKGDYNGQEADHILLDFYITNVPGNQLSANGRRVRYAIDGATTGEITSWVPHYIDNLPDGAHTITLDLLGPDGQPVAGMFNHTERTINVNHAAPSTSEHTHGGAPAAGVDAGAPAATGDAGR
jgi:hypothetical protein